MLPPAEVSNPELPSGPQTAIPTSKLKLLDQVRREIRLRHYSLRTEEAYVDWIKRFIHFEHPCFTCTFCIRNSIRDFTMGFRPICVGGWRSTDTDWHLQLPFAGRGG